MDGTRKGFLVALAISLVSMPALAVVAAGLLGGEAQAGDVPPATAAAVVDAGRVPVSTAGEAAAAPDLEVACTVEGADLVAGEVAGRLNDLQQAALDALRPICESARLSLAAAPAAAIAAAATVASPPPAPGVLPGGGGDETEHEDDYGSPGWQEDDEDESGSEG